MHRFVHVSEAMCVVRAVIVRTFELQILVRIVSDVLVRIFSSDYYQAFFKFMTHRIDNSQFLLI